MAQPEIIKDIEARVKKSGDTMTGKLYTTSNLDGSLACANTNGAFRIDGGTDYQTGAFLSLNGTDSPYYPNAFQLVASNGVTRKELFGNTDGTLTWDNNIILHNGNFSNYALPLSGGTMTGTITLASKGYQTNDAAGYYTDGYGNFVHSQAETKDYWHIDNNAKTISLKYYFETGNLSVQGTMTAPTFIGSLQGNATSATICDYPKDFTGRGSGGWGVQTGTSITDWSDGAGGDIDFRKNCPNSGQTSIKVDGRFYQNEGTYMCLDTNNFSGYALPLIGGTMSGWINFASIASWPTVSGETYPINSNGLYWVGSSDWARIFYRVSASDTGNLVVQLGDDTNCNFIIENSAGTVYSTINNRGVSGAVWNDYAEYRKAESIEPGRVVIESADGEMKLSTERLQPGAEIISDTFGFAIGETDEYKTPIAATGRVLAYPNEDRYSYPLGCAVCSGPNGTVSQMTREEIREYPERIIGTVSEIPEYKNWGTGNVEVNGRIWIRIK